MLWNERRPHHVERDEASRTAEISVHAGALGERADPGLTKGGPTKAGS